MWQVVYIASKEEARTLRDRLVEEGFLVKLEAMDESSYQIKVPESEAEEVYDLIHEWL
ncbi:MAG TPA: hypothetical protein GXZ20_00080 [Halanaerobiaceae bacterium]|nr:hypothetical protein [Bacillota bacterium]HHU91517.1 hypothetical protein [Halanaerobiaceae bacterium]HOA41433.1 hypothetical protein [Halanaerobiales bacterium]HPZ63276.1 hypothetical protein [Halanaerobiales bacterium]HQD04502.1 hypothetical protein [Halanaerobiales bacterium]